jgi:membrane protein DedA with SNARE-associated domain
MIETFETLAAWLVDFVHALGYPGIFICTFLESTFAPIPSEATMVPVGYLIQQGEMSFWIAFPLSVAGTLAGSWFNYWIAKHYGRRFLLAYGHYVFFPPEKLAAIERYFASHGDVSIFTGRLIPGVRHVISFPAGLAHMNLKKFCIYTTIGGALWMLALILVGYAIGGNKALVKQYMPIITYSCLGLVICIVLLYTLNHRRKQIKNGMD